MTTICRSDFDEVIARARATDIADVAGRLGTKLKRVASAERAGPCPACGGVDRFSINVKRHVFNCRGFGGGDVIAMTQHALGSDFLAAVEFITGDVHHVASREPAPKPVLTLDDDKRRIERAREIWRASIDPRGTIAKDYLVGRRLELSDDIANRVIRFHPSLAWRERDGDPVIRVQAMIAAMRSIESDEIVAVSCRRLTPEGHKVGKPKFRGAAAGSAIKLDADEAVTHGLHIGEGVESCMSARQLGLKPTWALGSTNNIAAFPVLSGIECLTILTEKDNASAKAWQICGDRWHSAGREVLINRPIGGKDLNDALKGAA
jgi:Toprim domain